MNTKHITASNNYQGGYNLFYTGTRNCVGSYYPSKKAGYYYSPYTHAIINFEAATLKEAKALILRERR